MPKYIQIVLDNIRASITRGTIPFMSAREAIYNTSLLYIGTDVSPADQAPDELGCAESWSKVIQKACPGLNMPTFLSTREVYKYLYTSKDFELAPTAEALHGDTVISPTGSSSILGKIGHVGIVGKHQIMSNDSRWGTWEANYTLESWRRIFTKNGFPVLVFRKK